MTKRLKYYTKSNLKEKEVDENIMVTGPMQHVEPIPLVHLFRRQHREQRELQALLVWIQMRVEKLLTTKVYGEIGRDLRKAREDLIKKVCTEGICDESLEVFLSTCSFVL